jgi:hypothetical protein
MKIKKLQYKKTHDEFTKIEHYFLSDDIELCLKFTNIPGKNKRLKVIFYSKKVEPYQDGYHYDSSMPWIRNYVTLDMGDAKKLINTKEFKKQREALILASQF